MDRYALTFTTPKADAQTARDTAAMYVENLTIMHNACSTRLQGQFACITVQFDALNINEATATGITTVLGLRRAALTVDAWKVHTA